jgi:hypothetical protein
MSLPAFATIAASPEAVGLFLAPTEVEGWFRLGLRTDSEEKQFLTVTFNETGITGVAFNNVVSSVIYSTSDAPPTLPDGHVVINS